MCCHALTQQFSDGPSLYLQDDGADESVNGPGEGLGHSGPLETPQHDPPFTEDGEEVQHLCQSRANPTYEEQNKHRSTKNV